LKEKSKRRDKMARNFTEGWVEFLSKRVAKEVAAKLNTVQVKIFVNLFFFVIDGPLAQLQQAHLHLMDVTLTGDSFHKSS
jgi:hypothetical protein